MMLPGYDTWLGRYHCSEITVYCVNAACPNADGLTALYENEYGQGWITPEDCPVCHSELLDEPKEEDDDDDDD